MEAKNKSESSKRPEVSEYKCMRSILELFIQTQYLFCSNYKDFGRDNLI